MYSNRIKVGNISGCSRARLNTTGISVNFEPGPIGHRGGPPNFFGVIKGFSNFSTCRRNNCSSVCGDEDDVMSCRNSTITQIPEAGACAYVSCPSRTRARPEGRRKGRKHGRCRLSVYTQEKKRKRCCKQRKQHARLPFVSLSVASICVAYALLPIHPDTRWLAYDPPPSPPLN